jgi:hypothetical protein
MNVFPAKAGIHRAIVRPYAAWIPAFAGKTQARFLVLSIPAKCRDEKNAVILTAFSVALDAIAN